MTSLPSELPEIIESEDMLDEVLTRPQPELIDFMRTLSGPLVILGAGGKMGPTLSVLARRAVDAAGASCEIIAVSRFSDAQGRRWLEERGVKTLSADLLDRNSLAGLPDASNVIYLVGLKFGTQDNPARTWAVNTLVPSYVAERYPGARIAALSTGGVYPLVPVDGGGSREADALVPPGEYANSCIGRERIFEFYSRSNGTPVTLVRLSYAVELRYGVLIDIARRVYAGEPVDVTMGYLPYIWQGEANAMVIRSLGLAESPPVALNLTTSPPLKVRAVAQQLGERMGRPAVIVGEEAPSALWSNTERLEAALGRPAVTLDTMLRWTADWMMRGGRLLGKPTHFEVRDGAY